MGSGYLGVAAMASRLTCLKGDWLDMSSSDDPRPLMVEIARLLYDRFLTNSAGGNMSCRVGDRIYVTPRGLGSKHR